MHAITRLVPALLLALVLTGCGTGAGTGAGSGGPAASTPTSSSTSSSAPVTSTPAAEPTAEPVAGAPTRVLDDLRLPHQWTWTEPADASLQPLPSFCVDPPQRLRPPDTSDFRGRTSTRGYVSRSELLGIYATPGRARQAVAAWRGQAAACADGTTLDEAGGPYQWSVAEVGVRGADEAWTAREEQVGTRLADGRAVLSSVVVVRVGNAVWAELTRAPVRLDDAAARLQREVASAAQLVPVLAPYRDS